MNATYYLSYRRKRCTELPQILPDDRLRRLTVEQLRRSWMHLTAHGQHPTPISSLVNRGHPVLCPQVHRGYGLPCGERCTLQDAQVFYCLHVSSHIPVRFVPVDASGRRWVSQRWDRRRRFREDLLELPLVADEQALRGSAVELGDPFDNALEISAHRVGKPGPRWTEAAHRADANVTSSVN